ncbi:hypothetical protein PR202_ga28802 [Eleusine coracana subsp. coracana]|uniref:Plant heme peroxidase family profile domain-containing protein n=1 Tax=Eleusine coracana subsp. coracana TaxID=191504 RepID=A0AAV5DKJ7_ELECO|nr:hypothetical protein PR202_ga28802 [Eleusine coracana subsp. coracana]
MASDSCLSLLVIVALASAASVQLSLTFYGTSQDPPPPRQSSITALSSRPQALVATVGKAGVAIRRSRPPPRSVPPEERAREWEERRWVRGGAACERGRAKRHHRASTGGRAARAPAASAGSRAARAPVDLAPFPSPLFATGHGPGSRALGLGDVDERYDSCSSLDLGREERWPDASGPAPRAGRGGQRCRCGPRRLFSSLRRISPSCFSLPLSIELVGVHGPSIGVEELTQSVRLNASSSGIGYTRKTNIDSTFRMSLRANCPATASNSNTNLVPLDTMTPNSFDNAYFSNILFQRRLLHSQTRCCSTAAAPTKYGQGLRVQRRGVQQRLHHGNDQPKTGSQAQIRLSYSSVY